MGIVKDGSWLILIARSTCVRRLSLPCARNSRAWSPYPLEHVRFDNIDHHQDLLVFALGNLGTYEGQLASLGFLPSLRGKGYHDESCVSAGRESDERMLFASVVHQPDKDAMLIDDGA